MGACETEDGGDPSLEREACVGMCALLACLGDVISEQITTPAPSWSSPSRGPPARVESEHQPRIQRWWSLRASPVGPASRERTMARKTAKKTSRGGAAAPTESPAERVRRRKQFVLTKEVCKTLEIRAATIGTEQSLLVEDALRSLLDLEPLPDADSRKA